MCVLLQAEAQRLGLEVDRLNGLLGQREGEAKHLSDTVATLREEVDTALVRARLPPSHTHNHTHTQ